MVKKRTLAKRDVAQAASLRSECRKVAGAEPQSQAGSLRYACLHDFEMC